MAHGYGLDFDAWRETIAEILWRWGMPACVPYLRQALIVTVEAEQQAMARPVQLPESIKQITSFAAASKNTRWSDQFDYTARAEEQIRYGRLVEWAHFEHKLVYGLGSLEAFGALMGCTTPFGAYDSYGGWSWDAQHPEGRPVNEDLNAHGERFRANVWRVEACCGALEPTALKQLSEDSASFASEPPSFAQEIDRLLEAHYGLDEAARREALSDYERSGFLSHVTRYYKDRARETRTDLPEYMKRTNIFYR